MSDLPFTYDETEKQEIPVICLGMEFPNDTARREYFTGLLREKLRDPEFRKIEGFPIGEDEDILALSDPPYYCACPNPWIGDFIKEWEAEKPPKDDLWHYVREPFAADVSEGKNDPIYNAHSYHTKVPHKAIMRYILHYTSPGDIVFDGFCGTGMTGVAAQMCGDINTVRSLGYKVDEKTGDIFDPDSETPEKPISKLGARKAVLNDLSPAATFIAYNYNTPVDVAKFEREAQRILAEVEAECGWMYETQHVDKDGSPILDANGKPIMGKINYVVWSDVFVCPNCMNEVVFWDAAVDKKAGKVYDEFPCPHCSSELTKRKMEHAWTSFQDEAIEKNIRQAKQVPVLINYSLPEKRNCFDKRPDGCDLKLIDKINACHIPYSYPSVRMIEGKETRRNDCTGLTHVHHFYTKRNLYILASIKQKCCTAQTRLLFNSQLINLSKLNRFRPGVSFPYNPLSGTYYVGSQISESNVLTAYRNKLRRLIDAFGQSLSWNAIMTQSSTACPNMSVDYIFIDPPFGANLNYSELSSLWEKWLNIETNIKEEAIENSSQNKTLSDYRDLLARCFQQAYSYLKPGRWMTVEFSNTSASVWNSIQSALSDAGFIVANISALDKQQGSFKAVTTPTAVKQDLIISAYKPNGGFEERFISEADSEAGVWDFIKTHLKYLPVGKIKGGKLVTVTERDPRILFDQLIAYYVRKGYNIPMSSQDFQEGLRERFDERDGMYFLHEQALEYDKKKARTGSMEQGSLFVSDEASAIAWLRQLLKSRTLTFQEINPLFMQELSGWNKYEKMLELSELLEQNFLCYDGKDEVPSQIHTYLSTNWHEYRELEKDDSALMAKAENRWYVPDPNKASDLEKLRDKALLREFEEYRNASKKLKSFRLEAVRAGFKHAFEQRNYQTILTVGKKIPETVLEEDPKLLMWFDQAQMRVEE